jgi:hypothetical protein
MAKLLDTPQGSWAEGKTLTRNDRSQWKRDGSKSPEELHYFTPPDQDASIEVQVPSAMAAQRTPMAGTQIQSIATTRTDMGYGRNASSQNTMPVSMRRGKVAIDFQRLTLSSREDERLEPDTSKATGLGPVKIGTSTTIKELKAAQAQTDDYGLMTSST